MLEYEERMNIEIHIISQWYGSIKVCWVYCVCCDSIMLQWKFVSPGFFAAWYVQTIDINIVSLYRSKFTS